MTKSLSAVIFTRHAGVNIARIQQQEILFIADAAATSPLICARVNNGEADAAHGHASPHDAATPQQSRRTTQNSLPIAALPALALSQPCAASTQRVRDE